MQSYYLLPALTTLKVHGRQTIVHRFREAVAATLSSPTWRGQRGGFSATQSYYLLPATYYFESPRSTDHSPPISRGRRRDVVFPYLEGTEGWVTPRRCHNEPAKYLLINEK
jgi:hypothetical protein